MELTSGRHVMSKSGPWEHLQLLAKGVATCISLLAMSRNDTSNSGRSPISHSHLCLSSRTTETFSRLMMQVQRPGSRSQTTFPPSQASSCLTLERDRKDKRSQAVEEAGWLCAREHSSFVNLQLLEVWIVTGLEDHLRRPGIMNTLTRTRTSAYAGKR